MNRATPDDNLPRLISRFAQTALTSRQVAKRLWALLPARYQALKGEHARRSRSGGPSERLALTDPRYAAHIEELTSMSHAALRARIDYETHTMLYKARQSLRAFRR